MLAKNTEDTPWKKTPKVTTNVKIQSKKEQSNGSDNLETKNEEKKELEKVIRSEADRNSSFDTAKAKKVWKEFFKMSPSGFASTLINANIIVEKSPVIKVELLNNIALRSEFSTIRIALNPYLANNLNNDFVQLEIIDQKLEQQKPTKNLSEQEKLEELVKEFPLINEAMRRFGLKLEN